LLHCEVTYALWSEVFNMFGVQRLLPLKGNSPIILVEELIWEAFFRCLKFSAFMSYAVRGRNTTLSCLMTLKDP